MTPVDVNYCYCVVFNVRQAQSVQPKTDRNIIEDSDVGRGL